MRSDSSTGIFYGLLLELHQRHHPRPTLTACRSQPSHGRRRLRIPKDLRADGAIRRISPPPAQAVRTKERYNWDSPLPSLSRFRAPGQISEWSRYGLIRYTTLRTDHKGYEQVMADSVAEVMVVTLKASGVWIPW